MTQYTSTYVYVGRKVAHKEYDEAGLARLSKRKERFDWADGSGMRRGGLLGGVQPQVQVVSPVMVGLSDMGAFRGNPILRLGMAAEELRSLLADTDWTKCMAEVLEAHARYQEIYGNLPDPRSLALEAGLTIPALAWVVYLLHQDGKALALEPRSWHAQITPEHVRTIYDFWIVTHKEMPTFDDLCKVFFDPGNTYPLLQALDALEGLRLKRIVEEPLVPGGLTPVAPPQNMIPASELTANGGFHLQGLHFDKELKKVREELLWGITPPAIPKFTAEEALISLAWSKLLRQTAKTGRLPTLLELQAELIDEGAQHYSVGIILQRVRDIHRKTALVSDLLSKTEKGKASARDRVQKFAVQTKRLWTQESVSAKFAQITIDLLGFADIVFQPVPFGAIRTEEIFDLVWQRPALGLDYLCGTGGINEQDFSAFMRARNHERWIKGQEEISFGTRDDARITTGATSSVTEKYQHAREALVELSKLHGFNFSDAVGRYLEETVDASKPDYAGLALLTATFVKLVAKAEGLPERQAAVEDTWTQINDYLLGDKILLSQLKQLSPSLQALVLDLAMELLIERNALGAELIGDVIRGEILTQPQDQNAANALERKTMELRLKRSLMGIFGARATELAAALVAEPKNTDHGERALTLHELETLRNLFEILAQEDADHAWLFPEGHAMEEEWKHPFGHRALSRPLPEILDLIHVLDASDLSREEKINAFIALNPFTRDISEQGLSVENIVTVMAQTRKISWDLFRSFSTAVHVLEKNGRWGDIATLLRAMPHYLEKGFDADFLESWLRYIPVVDVKECNEVRLLLMGKIVSQCRVLGMNEQCPDTMFALLSVAIKLDLSFISQTLDEMIQVAQVQGIKSEKLFPGHASIAFSDIINEVWFFHMFGKRLQQDFPAEIIRRGDVGYAELLQTVQTIMQPWDMEKIMASNGLNLVFLDGISMARRTRDIPGTRPGDVFIEARLPRLAIFLNALPEPEKGQFQEALELSLRGRMISLANAELLHRWYDGGMSRMDDAMMDLSLQTHAILLGCFSNPTRLEKNEYFVKQAGPDYLAGNSKFLRQLYDEAKVTVDVESKVPASLPILIKALRVMHGYAPFAAGEFPLLLRSAVIASDVLRAGYSIDYYFSAVQASHILVYAKLWEAQRKEVSGNVEALDRKLRSSVREVLQSLNSTTFARGPLANMVSGLTVFPRGNDILVEFIPHPTFLGKDRDNTWYVHQLLADAFDNDAAGLNNRLLTFIILALSFPRSTDSHEKNMELLQAYLREVPDVDALSKKFDALPLFTQHPELLSHWQIDAAKKFLEIYAQGSAQYQKRDVKMHKILHLLRRWQAAIGPFRYRLIYGGLKEDSLLSYPVVSVDYMAQLEKAKANVSPTAPESLILANDMDFIKTSGKGARIALAKGFSLPAVVDPISEIAYVNEDYYARYVGNEHKRVAALLSIGILLDLQLQHAGLVTSIEEVSGLFWKFQSTYRMLRTALTDVTKLSRKYMKQIFNRPMEEDKFHVRSEHKAPGETWLMTKFGDKDIDQWVHAMAQQWAESNLSDLPHYPLLFEGIALYVDMVGNSANVRRPAMVEHFRRKFYDLALAKLGEQALFGWDLPATPDHDAWEEYHKKELLLDQAA